MGLALLLEGLHSLVLEPISSFKWICSQQVIRDVTPLVLGRPLKLCNFLDWKDNKASRLQSRLLFSFQTDLTGRCMQVVYKRYASLFFVMGIDESDNELITLEIIHHFVEILDRYFGNVCELDLIFNFHKVCICCRFQLSMPYRSRCCNA